MNLCSLRVFIVFMLHFCAVALFGYEDKGVGRKISRRGGATEKRPKNNKKDRKIALLSLYLLYLYHMKIQGGHGPPLPMPMYVVGTKINLHIWLTLTDIKNSNVNFRDFSDMLNVYIGSQIKFVFVPGSDLKSRHIYNLILVGNFKWICCAITSYPSTIC